MTNNPKILCLAFVGGIIPALFWLWFWLKEEEHREPRVILTICFIIGMVSVVLVLPIQKFVQSSVHSPELQILSWAFIEELAKYLVVVIVLFRTIYIDKPIDWPIYLITAALGFAAFENMLFLIKPISIGQATVGLLTGYLRFLGSTLLHAVSSGVIGIMAGLSFYMGNFAKKIYLLAGFILAIALHSVFNFFIMNNSGSEFLKIFAFLWVATIINLLLFEKLRRMSI
jgi:RsiW-degrading membrane proteinase PrsW (M82 family)